VTLRIMEIAARRCRGRVVSLLEGGYRPKISRLASPPMSAR